jgi:hypothetical protein
MVLAKSSRSAHINYVDRRTDDLAAPYDTAPATDLIPKTDAYSTAAPLRFAAVAPACLQLSS